MIQFDKTKFVSENAQNRYYDSISNQNLITERGLCVTRINWPTITAKLGRENGIIFVLNLKLLLFRLLGNFMPLCLNVIIERYL